MPRLSRTGLIALAAIAAAIQSMVLPAAAQTVKRIETLWTTTEAAAAPYVQAFEEGLASFGWIPGKNLAIRHNFTNADPQKLSLYAAEIVARKPDVIWTALNTGGTAVKQQTSVIPIVVGNSVDPVSVGLVASLNRPGGNVTGMTAAGTELYGKRVQILHQALPAVKSIGILYNEEFPGIASGVAVAEKAAAQMGLRVVLARMKGPGEMQAGIASLIDQGADALLIPSDNLTFLYRREIADMAIKARLPAIFAVREFCEVGGLLCYSINMKVVFKRSATLVDRIFRGANPGDLPVEQPSHFEFVVNMRTAQALGIQFDRAILSQIDDMLE